VTGSEGVEFIHENSGGRQGVRRGRKKSKFLLFRKIARIERTKNSPSEAAKKRVDSDEY
jgi:hypothetical protein